MGKMRCAHLSHRACDDITLAISVGAASSSGEKGEREAECALYCSSSLRSLTFARTLLVYLRYSLIDISGNMVTLAYSAFAVNAEMLVLERKKFARGRERQE